MPRRALAAAVTGEVAAVILIVAGQVVLRAGVRQLVIQGG